MSRLAPSICLVSVLAVLGCAPSDVNTTFATSTQMRRPDRVLIYDFAVSPDEVHLDRGMVGEVEAYTKGEPRLEGQLLSIDEANQAQRVVIGLGAGRSDVEASAQLFAATPTGLQKLEAFNTNMASGYMPGMAETMGAGGLGAHLAVAAAAGVLTHTIAEKLSADVDAEADRTADALAKQLEPYFRSHGWLAGEI